MSNDTARLAALEAKVAALETVTERLIEVANRLATMIGERTLLAAETQVELEEKIESEATELATAIRSRAPRGFKFPITIHQTVVENRPRDFWAWHLYNTDITITRTCRLENLLADKGLITREECSDLAVYQGRPPPPDLDG